LDMSTYRVEPDGMSGFRVVQTLADGHEGRIIANFPSRRAAEAWAEIQSEIEASEAQRRAPENGPPDGDRK
jgi:heme-degrading monooxygenase HmoA